MKCQVCRGAWHESTGMLVGSPQRFRACGPCWREMWKWMHGHTQKPGSKRRRVKADFYPPVPEIEGEE